METNSIHRFPFIWDYEMDQATFLDILNGKRVWGRLDQTWALVRLLEYASYADVIKLLGFPRLIKEWPDLRDHIRSDSRRRGFDFLVDWLPNHHPELCHG